MNESIVIYVIIIEFTHFYLDLLPALFYYPLYNSYENSYEIFCEKTQWPLRFIINTITRVHTKSVSSTRGRVEEETEESCSKTYK